MEAMKEALKRKLEESKKYKGGVVDQKMTPTVALDTRANDKAGLTDIDAEDLREENDLAPDVPSDDGAEQQMFDDVVKDGDKEEAGEQDMLRQILSAISDRSGNAARGPVGLAERAAAGAKKSLASMAQMKNGKAK